MSRARFPLLVLVLQVLGPVPYELDTAGPHLFPKAQTWFSFCVCAVLMEGSRERQTPWSGVTDDQEHLCVGVWIPISAPPPESFLQLSKLFPVLIIP